jgi:hypothetical protein
MNWRVVMGTFVSRRATILNWAGVLCIGLAIPAKLSWGQELILISPENAPTWEKEMAKGLLPYHHLVVLDFPVKRDGPANIAFMLQPFMHCYYSLESKGGVNGSVYCYVTNWKVFSGFDRNASWRNPKADMKALLPYAQALLDLAEVRARQFGALKEGELPSGQGASLQEAQLRLQDVLGAFNHQHFWDMQKELEAFVEATKHGQDGQKVAQLSAEIRKRLQATPATNPHPATVDAKR